MRKKRTEFPHGKHFNEEYVTIKNIYLYWSDIFQMYKIYYDLKDKNILNENEINI